MEAFLFLPIYVSFHSFPPSISSFLLFKKFQPNSMSITSEMHSEDGKWW